MKGFCELLCWVSKRALGNMRYLTINTRSNRVVIISSVITRIFFNSAILDSNISTYVNKDTHDLFMLCIVIKCQLYIVVLYIVVFYFVARLFLLFDFYSSFV